VQLIKEWTEYHLVVGLESLHLVHDLGGNSTKSYNGSIPRFRNAQYWLVGIDGDELLLLLETWPVPARRASVITAQA
jgi:hypothetical protein